MKESEICTDIFTVPELMKAYNSIYETNCGMAWNFIMLMEIL
jgi:hypothetical protein